MLNIYSVLSIFCVFLQPGYLQPENYYGTTVGEKGSNGPFPYWPFLAQGNDYTGTRRHRIPCIRRHNSQDPHLDNGEAQIGPNFTSRVVKSIVYNDNINSKPQSLKYNIPAEYNEPIQHSEENTVPIKIVSEDYRYDNVKPLTAASVNKNECDPKPVEAVSPEYPLEAEEIGANYEYPQYVPDNSEYKAQVNDNESLNKCANKQKSSKSLENKDEGSRRFLSNNSEQRDRIPIPVTSEKQNKSVQSPYNEDRVIKSSNDEESRKFQNVKVVKKPDDTLYNNFVGKSRVPTDGASVYDDNFKPKAVGSQLIEPTRGSGISDMTQSNVVLMENNRICYACSSASDSTCWTPDRRTTVKYCRKGNNACVSKTFKNENALVMIRDCGESCDDVKFADLLPKYKSCSICHSDFCNGAFSLSSQKLIYAAILLSAFNFFKHNLF